jgi:hypothetical protein
MQMRHVDHDTVDASVGRQQIEQTTQVHDRSEPASRPALQQPLQWRNGSVYLDRTRVESHLDPAALHRARPSGHEPQGQ